MTPCQLARLAEGRSPQPARPRSLRRGRDRYAPLYCFPLLAPEFETTFHASRELGQMPWTMFLVVSALASPLLGRAFDVIGDRLC